MDAVPSTNAPSMQLGALSDTFAFALVMHIARLALRRGIVPSRRLRKGLFRSAVISRVSS